MWLFYYNAAKIVWTPTDSKLVLLLSLQTQFHKAIYSKEAVYLYWWSQWLQVLSSFLLKSIFSTFWQGKRGPPYYHLAYRYFYISPLAIQKFQFRQSILQWSEHIWFHGQFYEPILDFKDCSRKKLVLDLLAKILRTLSKS